MWYPLRIKTDAPYSTFHNAVLFHSIGSLNPVWFYSTDQVGIGPACPASFEALNSEVGTDRVEMRPCQHYKMFGTVARNPVPNRTLIGLDTDWWVNYPWTPKQAHEWLIGKVGSGALSTIGTFEDLRGSLPLLYDAGQYDGDRIPSPHDLDNLLLRGFDALRPKIKPNASLLNSLYELKDFRSLPRTIAKCKQLTEHLLPLIGGDVQKWRRLRGLKTFKQIAKAAADGFLQWNFNLAPLVSDIAGIHSALTDARKQLSKLRARAGTRMRSHWGCDILDSYPSGVLTQYAQQLGPNNGARTRDVYKWSKEWRYGPSRFTFTLDHSFTLSSVGALDLEMAALLDVIGVNLNPAIIWNALPWSFVVDWVVGVNAALSKFTKTNVTIDTVIHQACWSWLVRRDLELWVSYDSISEAVIKDSQTLRQRSVTEVAYKRKRLPIADLATFRTSGLSLKEASLATALGVGRL